MFSAAPGFLDCKNLMVGSRNLHGFFLKKKNMGSCSKKDEVDKIANRPCCSSRSAGRNDFASLISSQIVPGFQSKQIP